MLGTRIKTINFGWCEAISDMYVIEGKKSRGGWVDVKFDNTGYVKRNVIVDFFNQGCVRDSSIPIVIEIGQIYHTNLSGDVKIIGGDRNLNIQIEFLESGNTYKAQKDALLTGFVKDKPSVDKRLVKEEEEKQHRKYVAECEASVRKNAEEHAKRIKQAKKDERAKLIKEHKEFVEASKQERKHKNESLLQKALDFSYVQIDQTTYSAGLLNVDFKDIEGKWVLRYRNPKTKDFVQTRLGKLHNNMTQRGKKDSALQDVHNKSYNGVSVSEEFKNAQTFCDWAVQQPGWGLGYDLEKDLLVDGNREYSSEACCFLPADLNMVIAFKGKVDCIKSGECYTARASARGESFVLGRFETEEEATSACLEYKHERAMKLLEIFKPYISPKAVDKLIELFGKSH
jgi:hypothetical protein